MDNVNEKTSAIKVQVQFIDYINNLINSKKLHCSVLNEIPLKELN